MFEKYYWVVLIFVFVAYVFFNGRNAEHNDLKHVNMRSERKKSDIDKLDLEDKYLIGLYSIDKNKAINWYREKHGTSLRFTQKIVDEIAREKAQ